MNAPKLEAAWARYEQQTLITTLSPKTVSIAHAAFLAGAAAAVGMIWRAGVESDIVETLRKELDSVSVDDMLGKGES